MYSPITEENDLNELSLRGDAANTTPIRTANAAAAMHSTRMSLYRSEEGSFGMVFLFLPRRVEMEPGVRMAIRTARHSWT